jgi:hypothetical protein
MHLDQFIKKYGTTTPSLLINSFLDRAGRAPKFPGRDELMGVLRDLCVDLESALEDASRDLGL